MRTHEDSVSHAVRGSGATGLLGARIAPALPPDVWVLVLQKVLSHRERPALRRYGYLSNGTLK